MGLEQYKLTEEKSPKTNKQKESQIDAETQAHKYSVKQSCKTDMQWTMRVVDGTSEQTHVLKRVVTVGIITETWKEVNMESKTYV